MNENGNTLPPIRVPAQSKYTRLVIRKGTIIDIAGVKFTVSQATSKVLVLRPVEPGVRVVTKR